MFRGGGLASQLTVSFVVQPGSTCADGICPNSATSSALRTSMMTASFCRKCRSTSSVVTFTIPGNDAAPSVTCTSVLDSVTTDTDLDVTDAVCCSAIIVNSEVTNALQSMAYFLQAITGVRKSIQPYIRLDLRLAVAVFKYQLWPGN